MELTLIDDWERTNRFSLREETRISLVRYSHLIYAENKKHNITGFRTVDEIISNLLLKSIDPLVRHNVPRGTLLFDLGSGSGSPGIPIALVLEESRMVLIESNRKKAEFIARVLSDLGMNNCTVLCSRGEDVARMMEYRERGDWVFSRAFGPLFTVIELGAPLLRTGGFLYVYGNDEYNTRMNRFFIHMKNLGLSLECREGEVDEVLFRKASKTDERYPRRYAVIKREASCMG